LNGKYVNNYRQVRVVQTVWIGPSWCYAVYLAYWHYIDIVERVKGVTFWPTRYIVTSPNSQNTLQNCHTATAIIYSLNKKNRTQSTR